MDQDIVYTKTQAGEDAVRQRTRVVQRNQRVVLVQVDGKTPVSELAAKIGSAKLVEDALNELENGGYVMPLPQAISVWERGKRAAKDLELVISRFSAFAPKSPASPEGQGQSPESAMPSGFSAFGKPILAGPASPLSSASPKREEPGRHILPRRPLGWRPMVLGLLLLSALTAVLFPYDHFKPRLEAALQGMFQARVRIGSVALDMLPRPALTVGTIEIGGASELSIEKIRIPLTWSLLTGDLRRLPEAHVSGVAAPLGIVAVFLRPGPDAGAGGFLIRRTVFQGLVLRTKDGSSAAMEGEVLFAENGGLEKVLVRTADRTLQLAALPAAQGMQLTIEGFGWRPLPGEPYVFESLQAKGLLLAGKLVLNDIDSSFMGGVLKGNWLLDWSRGMAMAGEASLTRLDLRRVTQTFAPSLELEGELDGHLNLRAKATDWAGMWGNVEAGIDAHATRGTAHGIDIGEAARRGVGQGASGGATKFDSLRGRLDINPQHVRSEDLRLEAGLVAASGRFVADRAGRVDGAFDVSIKGSAGGIRVPIRISGTLPNLVATAGR